MAKVYLSQSDQPDAAKGLNKSIDFALNLAVGKTMREFIELLRGNRNYRLTWSAQIVSEIGDNFNNVAVFALVMALTHSGVVVTGILLSRTIPVIIMGPLAGVLLDRFDRKLIMIASDLVRAFVALAFIFSINSHTTWVLYFFSALLMFASPFFTAGRSAILPSIVSPAQIHTANSITQTTQWMTLAIGSFLGAAVLVVGYKAAFVVNAISFLISAERIWRLKAPDATGFVVRRKSPVEGVDVLHPWREFVEGLKYMRSVPLVFAITLLSVGWATGGGAAQILFTLFGTVVFNRGATGIGLIWGCAGLGALSGGIFGNWLGKRLSFESYKLTVFVNYIILGAAYVLFCQSRRFDLALAFIFLSRASMAVNSILNFSYLLRIVPDRYRGRVFASIETLMWAMMLASMMGAGVATTHYSPRLIGTVAGLLSSTTAIFWGIANWSQRLPSPNFSQNEEIQ